MTWDIFTVIRFYETCTHHPVRRGLGEYRRSRRVAKSCTCIRYISSIKFWTWTPSTVLVSRRKLTIMIRKTKLWGHSWRVVKMLRWAIFRMPPLWSPTVPLVWMFHICCPGHREKSMDFCYINHTLNNSVKIFSKTKSTSVKVCKQRFQYGGPKYYNLLLKKSLFHLNQSQTESRILFSSSLLWKLSE